MEKRMILAIALSIAVLIGYQYFYSPAPPPCLLYTSDAADE